MQAGRHCIYRANKVRRAADPLKRNAGADGRQVCRRYNEKALIYKGYKKKGKEHFLPPQPILPDRHDSARQQPQK